MHLHKTKPASTLFITMIPNGVSMETIDEVFKAEPGYFAFRTVRQMVFIDYNTTYAATAAMRKLQNHKFPGFESSRGIAIDYGTIPLSPHNPGFLIYPAFLPDKDPTSKRNKQYERQSKDAQKQARESSLTKVRCVICGTRCLKLANNSAIKDLPKRKTDGSFVIDEAKQLRDLRVCKGESKMIKRPKGKEKQYRLNCTACDVCLGYRPVPLDTPTKYLYVLSGAVSDADKETLLSSASAPTAPPAAPPAAPAAAAPPPAAAVPPAPHAPVSMGSVATSSGTA
jgi:hypothetical protein